MPLSVPLSVSGWRETLARRGLWPALAAVVAAQVVVDLSLLRYSYFFAEDFGELSTYSEGPLDLDLLSSSVFGHFIPGLVIVQRYVGAWFGADWVVTSALTCLIQVGGTIAFARLMLALRGAAWWIPWASAAFALGIVSLNTVPWWAATLAPQVAVVAGVSTWGCAVRYARTGRPRHLVGLAVMFVLAVSFFEKSLAVGACLGLFVLLVGTRQTDDGWRDRAREAVRLWPVWGVLATISALDLAVYATGPYLGQFGEPAGATDTVEYLARSLPEGVFPSLIGAINPTSPLPGPGALTPVVATALVLSVIVWTSMRSGVARRAWAWFVLSALLSQLLVARGRLQLLGIDTTVRELRFQVDSSYLFLIALAVALPAAVHTLGPAARARVAITVAVAPLVFMPLWLQSLQVIADTSTGPDSRHYFAQLRAADLPEDAAFLDVPLPEWLVPSAMHPWNLAGTVYPQARPGVALTHDPEGALWIRPDGSIGPVQLRDLTTPTSDPVCLEAGEAPVQVLTPPGVALYGAPPSVLLVLSQDSAGPAWLQLGTGAEDSAPDDYGAPIRLDRPGSFAAGVRLDPDAAVYLSLASGSRVCVDEVRLAVPEG